MIANARPMTAGSAISSDDWCTPKWLCGLLGRFDFDPCSNERSHVQADCLMSGGGDHDCGLSMSWGRASIFVNPPYSNVTPWAVKHADWAPGQSEPQNARTGQTVKPGGEP
jgi:hypothetical protein